MDYLVLIAALLPVALLLLYIYRKDKSSPEPAGQLIKAFFFGILSVPLSLCVSVPLGMAGLYVDEPVTFLECLGTSFLGAAVPEEVAKLFMLWLLLRRNRYFDEKMDGIVYAVCVSMGFAALENIIYLFSNYDDYISVGISRALFAVPGHFAFGVLMGYYYSMVRFYPAAPRKYRLMLIAVPVLVHGVYDAILFTAEVAPLISGVLVIVFLVFCFQLWKHAGKKIAEHLERDKMTINNNDSI